MFNNKTKNSNINVISNRIYMKVLSAMLCATAASTSLAIPPQREDENRRASLGTERQVNVEACVVRASNSMKNLTVDEFRKGESVKKVLGELFSTFNTMKMEMVTVVDGERVCGAYLNALKTYFQDREDWDSEDLNVLTRIDAGISEILSLKLENLKEETVELWETVWNISRSLRIWMNAAEKDLGEEWQKVVCERMRNYEGTQSDAYHASIALREGVKTGDRVIITKDDVPLGKLLDRLEVVGDLLSTPEYEKTHARLYVSELSWLVNDHMLMEHFTKGAIKRILDTMDHSRLHESGLFEKEFGKIVNKLKWYLKE